MAVHSALLLEGRTGLKMPLTRRQSAFRSRPLAGEASGEIVKQRSKDNHIPIRRPAQMKLTETGWVRRHDSRRWAGGGYGPSHRALLLLLCVSGA